MLATSTLPTKIASRYVPVRLIGKGGMGVVYEVVHERTGEHLALKVLQSSAGAPAEALERFKREARAPAQIRSENVVHVSDADVAPELDGAPFLVMELLEGMDLERAASLSRPEPATVVGWLRQIAPALDKAHRLGIIHRDLKPENLFLANVEDRPPVVKILDFGIAKMAEEGSAATVSGQVLGTPKYMAPEQAERHPRVTAATDRYALGLVAYRLLFGESYYRGSVMSILAELLHGPTTAPSARDPRFGPAFDTWFSQACHRDPERRFASASQQVEALAEALGLPSGAGDVLHERRSSSPPGVAAVQGFGLRAFAAAGLLLAVIAAVLVYRASTARRSEVSVAPGVSAVVRREPPAAPVAVVPVPAATVAAGALTQPAASEARTARPPAATAPAAVSSKGAPVKARPGGARAITVSASSKATAPDPFGDQK